MRKSSGGDGRGLNPHQVETIEKPGISPTSHHDFSRRAATGSNTDGPSSSQNVERPAGPSDKTAVHAATKMLDHLSLNALSPANRSDKMHPTSIIEDGKPLRVDDIANPSEYLQKMDKEQKEQSQQNNDRISLLKQEIEKHSQYLEDLKVYHRELRTRQDDEGKLIHACLLNEWYQTDTRLFNAEVKIQSIQLETNRGNLAYTREQIRENNMQQRLNTLERRPDQNNQLDNEGQKLRQKEKRIQQRIKQQEQSIQQKESSDHSTTRDKQQANFESLVRSALEKENKPVTDEAVQQKKESIRLSLSDAINKQHIDHAKHQAEIRKLREHDLPLAITQLEQLRSKLHETLGHNPLLQKNTEEYNQHLDDLKAYNKKLLTWPEGNEKKLAHAWLVYEWYQTHNRLVNANVEMQNLALKTDQRNLAYIQQQIHVNDMQQNLNVLERKSGNNHQLANERRELIQVEGQLQRSITQCEQSIQREKSSDHPPKVRIDTLLEFETLLEGAATQEWKRLLEPLPEKLTRSFDRNHMLEREKDRIRLSLSLSQSYRKFVNDSSHDSSPNPVSKRNFRTTDYYKSKEDFSEEEFSKWQQLYEAHPDRDQQDDHQHTQPSNAFEQLQRQQESAAVIPHDQGPAQQIYTIQQRWIDYNTQLRAVNEQSPKSWPVNIAQELTENDKQSLKSWFITVAQAYNEAAIVQRLGQLDDGQLSHMTNYIHSMAFNKELDDVLSQHLQLKDYLHSYFYTRESLQTDIQDNQSLDD